MKKENKVLVNVGTHGTEQIALKVLERIKNISIKKGELITYIAHPVALKKKVRFIETDLNRSFPGNKRGSLEQKLAYKIKQKLKNMDVVIDIHSTESGIRETMIVTKYTKEIKELVKAVGPKYLFVMEVSKKSALISGSKIGLAFEYGKDKDLKTLEGTMRGIVNILKAMGVVEGKCNPHYKKTKVYVIQKPFPKTSSQKLIPTIQNFKFVKKGEVVAKDGGKYIRAPQSFYPVLFRKNTYKDIFGFMGEYKEEI